MSDGWGPLSPKYQRLLNRGNPSIVDELGCFRCGNMTGDLGENGLRYINCAPCRAAIRQEMIRNEIDRMDWPEIVV